MPSLSDIYKSAVPTNVRLFGSSLMGNKEPITEKDFSEQELKAMKLLIKQKAEQDTQREQVLRQSVRKPDEYMNFPNMSQGKEVPYDAYLADKNAKIGTFDKTRGKTSVSYSDYPEESRPDSKGWIDTVKSSYNNPQYGVATTLGQFNAQDMGNRYQVKDTYDWNPSGPPTLDDFFELLKRPEAIGNALMRLGPGVKRPVNIDLPK